MRLGSLLVLACLAGCSAQGRPPEQVSFSRRLVELREEWRQREGNDIRRTETEGRARELFESRPRATAWVATVVKVAQALGSTWIVAREADVTYFLRSPAMPGALEQFLLLCGDLVPGDTLRFSGDLGAESSITMVGGILRPEFPVTLSHIERTSRR